MALTNRVALAATIGACALLAVRALPPEPPPSRAPERSARTTEAQQRDRLFGHLERERTRLALMRATDSLLALASSRAGAAGDAPGALTVLVDEDLPDSVRREIEAEVRAGWAELRPTGTPVIFAVVTTADTGGGRRELGVRAVPPPLGDGRRCLALYEASRRVILHRRTLTSWTEYFRFPAVLGMCRFWGAFGTPGPGIERWLAARDNVLGALGDWRAPRPPLRPPTSSSGRIWSIDERRYLVSALGERCLAGDLSRCARSILDTTGARVAERPLPEQPMGQPSRHWTAEDRYWLADLAYAAGPERFGAFWRSPAPPERAFAAAMGRPLGAYVREWARARFGAPVPPPVRPATLLRSALLVALAIGASLLVGHRRQVG